MSDRPAGQHRRRRNPTGWALVLTLVTVLWATTSGGPAVGAAVDIPLPPVAGLLSRWRAADLPLNDGDPVTSWTDSVSGVTLAAPSASRQPVFRASAAALGNMPAVSFDQSTLQSLTGSVSNGQVPAGYLAGTSGVTVIVVMATSSTVPSPMTMWFASTGSSGTAARVLDQVTGASQPSIGGRRLDTDALATVAPTNASVMASTPLALTGSLDFSGNQGTQYLNGQLVATKPLGGAGLASATGSQRVALGVNGSDANGLTGSVAEVLVYSGVLSAADRTSVDSYIQDTYGVPMADYLSSSGSPTPTPTPTPTTSTPPPPLGPVPTRLSVASTIAAPATLAAGTTTQLAVTASTAGVPLPGAVVYLKLQQTPGGGTAAVGGTALTTAYQPFLADASGHVTVAYQTPGALPGGGKDVITAANQPLGATASTTTGYAYSAIAHWRWSPEPTAPPGSLAPAQHVPVTVTALDASWAPLGGAQVCLSFTPAKGGGSAALGGQPLGRAYTCTIADAGGNVTVDAATAAVLPATGIDRFDVRDTAGAPYAAASFHGYSYGQVVQAALTPAPIAPVGTLAPKAKVTVVVTPKDATGAQVAGATVTLWLESSSGASATVAGYASAPDGTQLDLSPRRFVTHTITKLTITYKLPAVIPSSGVDRLVATTVSADGQISSRTVAEYWFG